MGPLPPLGGVAFELIAWALRSTESVLGLVLVLLPLVLVTGEYLTAPSSRAAHPPPIPPDPVLAQPAWRSSAMRRQTRTARSVGVRFAVSATLGSGGIDRMPRRGIGRRISARSR